MTWSVTAEMISFTETVDVILSESLWTWWSSVFIADPAAKLMFYRLCEQIRGKKNKMYPNRCYFLFFHSPYMLAVIWKPSAEHRCAFIVRFYQPASAFLAVTQQNCLHLLCVCAVHQHPLTHQLSSWSCRGGQRMKGKFQGWSSKLNGNRERRQRCGASVRF